jgi:protein kinase A
MVLDFVQGGELFTLLRKSQRFPESVAKFFAAEVATGLDYLHGMGVVYRDLKPENVLIGKFIYSVW